MLSFLAAIEPLTWGGIIMAAVALLTTVVTYLNQRTQSKTSKDTESLRVASAKQIAEIAADATVETALVANFANALNTLEEGHRKLRAEVESEQEKRRLLAQKVADLELEGTRKQATIEKLERDLATKRAESEQEITSLHDENLLLHNQVKLLQEECSGLRQECAQLRRQIANITDEGAAAKHEI